MQTFLIAALRPLARLCISRGIKVQPFFEAAKCAFSAAASDELQRLGSKPSVSRIAAMTGLQRKEIKRLNLAEATPLGSNHFLLRLLERWSTDRALCDKKGAPRPLTLAGDNNEFGQLVAALSTDMSPYTALFELERLGAVRREGGTVRLVHASIQISHNEEAALSLLAEDVGYLVSSGSANIDSGAPVPNLHARTQYDNIAPGAVPEIKRWLLERGAEFHREARAFLSRFDRDLNPTIDPSPSRVTVTVGTFSDVQEDQQKIGEKR